jgi:hypothetical protein
MNPVEKAEKAVNVIQSFYKQSASVRIIQLLSSWLKGRKLVRLHPYLGNIESDPYDGYGNLLINLQNIDEWNVINDPNIKREPRTAWIAEDSSFLPTYNGEKAEQWVKEKFTVSKWTEVLN